MSDARSLSVCEVSRLGRCFEIPEVSASRMVESSDARSAGVPAGEAVARMGIYAQFTTGGRDVPALSATELCESEKGECDTGEALLLFDKRVLGGFSSPGRGTSMDST